jgi:[ribosomal protein S5]-alanine N-acetyltransferase
MLLTTSRLIIRDLRESDLEDFHRYRSDPEITRFQGFDAFSKEQAREFIAENKIKKDGVPGQWVQYGIEELHTKKLIGDCAIQLHLPETSEAEIGITISPLYQRKGYAKETMSEILNLLFNEKEISRIVERVDTENMASIALMKGLFFRQENPVGESIFSKGIWTSEFRFVMLKEEWISTFAVSQKRSP